MSPKLNQPRHSCYFFLFSLAGVMNLVNQDETSLLMKQCSLFINHQSTATWGLMLVLSTFVKNILVLRPHVSSEEKHISLLLQKLFCSNGLIPKYIIHKKARPDLSPRKKIYNKLFHLFTFYLKSEI